MNERYFDNAATTPVDPRVLEAMLPYFCERPGNAHSIHSAGTMARDAVEVARSHVARLIGAESPDNIVFTSGGTEANNWVLQACGGGAVSPFEHVSVRDPAMHIGYEVLGHDGLSLRDPGSVGPLVSIMAVNNEIGSLFEANRFAATGRLVHSDSTQAVGKIPFDVGGLDFATLSGHKMHGPKGVGALYIRDLSRIEPLLHGGDQESGLRSGTLNVSGIVGMGKAAEIAIAERELDAGRAAMMRGLVVEALRKCPDWQINGGAHVSPYILSISFAELEGETLVVEMDARGFAIGSGPACSSRSPKPSHVLQALGVPEVLARGTVRISFGRFNTPDQAALLGKILKESVESTRKMRKSAQSAT